MKKVVYVRESGDDKNSGLSEKEAVRTRAQAIKVSIREGTQEFDIRGSRSFIEKISGWTMTEEGT